MINKAQITWGDVKIPGTSSTGDKPVIAVKTALPAEQIWFNFSAFIFGMASINGLYPFGLAYMASSALYKKKIISAGIFAFLGTLASLRSPMALRYLFAMVIFAMAYTISPKFRRGEFMAGFMLFASDMVSGMLYLGIKGYTPYDLLILAMESIIAAILVYIIPAGLPWVFKISVGEAERNICMAIVVGVVMSITGGIELFGISLRNILGVLAVQMAAFLGGAGAGASAGIIIGIAGFLLPLAPWSVAVLAFSGLIAGTFNKLGKFGVAGGFALGYIIYNLYVNSMGEGLITIPVLMISTALFLIMPLQVLNKVKKYMVETVPNSSKSLMLDMTRDRLCEIAVALEDIGEAYSSFEEPSESALYEKYLDRFCHEVQERVCHDCGLYRICWEKDEEHTIRSLYTLLKNYQAGLRDTLPILFKKRCEQFETIKKIADSEISIYNFNRQINNITRQQQNIISKKFHDAGRFLKDLANGIPEEDVDTVMVENLTERFKQLGIKMDHLWACFDHQRTQVYMSMSPCEGEKLCEKIIPKALSEYFNAKFYVNALSCPAKGNFDQCRMKAVSIGNLGVAVGVAAAAKQGYETIGDGFAFSELDNGKFMLALSDGMGVGKKAAEHSEKTLSVLERFLEMGFEDSTVLNITNSYMTLFAREERFSTIDLTLIDTYTGKTSFIKAGSAPSFIMRGAKVEIIKGGSLPVGIMDTISPKIINRDLKTGDTVVMVTDGVIEGFSGLKNGEEALSEFLSKIKTSNPQEIADAILKKASENGVKDDMTVMTARIWEKFSS